MQKENVLNNAYSDILFENRNKLYGAYYLRKKQKRYVLLGLLIACSSLFIGLSLPYILDFFKRPDFNFDDTIVVNYQMTTPPKGEITPVYMPPPPPAKQKIEIPVLTKEIIPEDKKKEDDPKKDVSNAITEARNKDTAQKSPGSGLKNGVENQIFLRYDQVPTLVSAEYSGIGDYIKKNARYPELEKLQKHHGRVIVTATVNKDGTLENIHLHNSISVELNKEALRVISSLPRLTPAMINGKPVRIYYQFPIDFDYGQAETQK